MKATDASKNNFLTVNETVVRLNAIWVSVFSVVIFVVPLYLLSLCLAVDFFLRAFTTIKSPFALLSQTIAGVLKLKPKPIYAPPKKFAAAVGFAFSMAITALLLSNFSTAALVTNAVLLICALLESIVGICVGCYVYDWVIAPLKKTNSGD